MRRVCNRLLADLRLGLNFVIVNAGRVRASSGLFGFGVQISWGRRRSHCNRGACDQLRADERLSFTFAGAATACIVHAARVRAPSG